MYRIAYYANPTVLVALSRVAYPTCREATAVAQHHGDLAIDSRSPRRQTSESAEAELERLGLGLWIDWHYTWVNQV